MSSHMQMVLKSTVKQLSHCHLEQVIYEVFDFQVVFVKVASQVHLKITITCKWLSASFVLNGYSSAKVSSTGRQI